MKVIAVFIVPALFLAACAPSEDAIATAIAQTEAAKPTLAPTQAASPTPKPLTAADLEAVLLLPGDLPKDIEGDQYLNGFPPGFQGMPQPDLLLRQEFVSEAYRSDGVLIAVYPDAETRAAAWRTLIAAMEKNGLVAETPIIGEQSALSSDILFGIHSVRLAWVRCTAIVKVGLFHTAIDIEKTKAYAQRLDGRLGPLLCQ